MISMKEVYGVTSFLRGELHVDREYPFDFNISKNDELSNIEPRDKASLVSDEALVHNNSILFKGLSSKDSILITLSARKFDRSNRFEIKIKSGTEIDLNNVSVSFSESSTGELSLMTLKPLIEDNQTSKIGVNIPSIVEFVIYEQEDVNAPAERLSNVRSISINFNQNIEELFLIDAVFKNDNPEFTIEDVEEQLDEAEKYVSTRLKKTVVPSELDYLFPKAAAAFIHRIKWQNEGQFQKDKSYAHYRRYSQQLLSEIDDTIESYRDENEGDENDINMNLVGSRYL